MAAKKLVIKLTAKQAKGIREALGISRPCQYLQVALPEDSSEVLGMDAHGGFHGDITVGMVPPPPPIRNDATRSVWLF